MPKLQVRSPIDVVLGTSRHYLLLSASNFNFSPKSRDSPLLLEAGGSVVLLRPKGKQTHTAGPSHVSPYRRDVKLHTFAYLFLPHVDLL